MGKAEFGGAHQRKNQAAKALAATPKRARNPRGRRMSAKPPPKLSNWFKASSAQPVGRQWAMVWRTGGPISTGHQQPPRAPISRDAMTHRPTTLSSPWRTEPTNTPKDAATQE